MAHDQVFKDFLRSFLRGFLKLFYPEVEASLDFQTLRFLDKELFTDFPKGSLREADVVAEIHTHRGSPELILIHIEVEAEKKPDFPLRMFQYFALLWLRYQVPIFPIVLYLRGGRRDLGDEEFRMTLFEREQLRFRYQGVALARLDGWEYVEKGDPVAAALAALMSHTKARDPLELRLRMLQRVAQSGLDDARKFVLLNLVETYFKLDPEKNERFRRLLRRPEYQEVKEMQLTWAEEMKEQGRVEGKREALLRQLKTKFGPLPQAAMSRVRTLESMEKLDTYLDRVLTAKSLADMGLQD